MNTRTFALVWGILFLLITASGLIPGLWHPAGPDHPDLQIESQYGDALGLWPVNILHNIVHLLFGVWGIVASRSWDGARTYAKAVAIVYSLFVIMGLVPGLDTTFGFVPLFGNDIWLHILLAAPAYYFGFMRRDTAADNRR
jgi:hypothetical protein